MKGTFGLNTCPDTTRCVSSNLDFYIIDREHGRASLTEAATLLASISSGCKRFIRVSSLERVEIQRVLELLPDGILIPQISSFTQAQEAVDYSFFPPVGSRGISPYTRGFNFIHDDLENKKKKINSELKLGLLIEGKGGFDALPEIMKMLSEDIDLIYFGLFDFANSQGLDPDWNNPQLSSILTSIISLAKKSGVSVGTIARTKNDISILNDMGVEYIVYLNDLGIIHNSIMEV